MVNAKPTHEHYPALLQQIKNGLIKIPQFQRDFVWTVSSSANLLDSVVKGYPVGTFIFWHTDERLRSVRNIGGDDLPEPPEGQMVDYVLDGQQRLTSLYAALEGKQVLRPSGRTDDFSKIYVDLKASGSDPVVTADVSGREAGSFISLTELLHGGLKIAKKYDEKYWDSIGEYSTRIESYNFPITHVTGASMPVATDIFTRINVGGKTLTTFEIMAAKTYDETRNFDLTEKHEELVQKLAAIEYETLPEATPLQLVALLLSRESKREAILDLKRDAFVDEWPHAAEAIENACEYIRKSYGARASRLLPYNGLVVTFAYFFRKTDNKAPSSEQQRLLADFFWRCSLGNRYSSSLDSKLAQDILRVDKIIAETQPKYDWPVDIKADFILSNGWFTPSRAFAKAILCLLAHHQPRSFDNGAPVTIGNDYLKQANSKNYHHIFPKSLLEKQGFTRQQSNTVANIAIIDAHLNKNKIRAKAPSVYLGEYKKTNKLFQQSMDSHLMGDFVFSGWRADDYTAFLRKRAEAISAELGKYVIYQDVDDNGQEVRTDDLEEDDALVD